MNATRSGRRKPPYVISAGTHMNSRMDTAWQKRRISLSEEIEKENANLISWATAEISVPGLRQIQNPNYNKLGKLFWFLCICIASVLCTQQVTYRCILFSKSPISNNVLLSRDDFVDFPATTICTTRSSLFNKAAKEKLVVHEFPKTSNDTAAKTKRYQFWEKNLEAVGNDVTLLWKLMAISLDNIDVVDSCPNKTCFSTRYISTYKGDCVIIEAKEKVFHRGSLTGVSVTIRTLDPSIGQIDENLIKIYVHENDWTPIYFNYYDTGIYHGHITTITLTRRKFEFINTKKDPCTTTKKTADCWRTCLEQGHKRIANTSCRIPPMAGDMELCSDATRLSKAQHAVIKRFENRENEQCTQCPRRCSEVLFNILQDVVKPGKNGSTVLHIYIPDNTIDSLNEAYTYDFVSFLCELGGTLGLFLGFCSLTLIELIEVVFVFLIMHFKKRHAKSFSKQKKIYPEKIKKSNKFGSDY